MRAQTTMAPGHDPGPPEVRTHRSPAIGFSRHAQALLAMLMVGALGFRVLLATRYPLNTSECLAIRRSLNREYVFLPSDWHSVYAVLHTPLHPITTSLWLKFISVLGLGHSPVWVRASGFPVSVLSMLLVARVGMLFRAPYAGLAAAAILGFAPAFALLGIEQGNYIFELTSALWFIERGVRLLVWREPVWRSLAFAAVLAVWAGYMNVLVVGPGMCLVALAAHRRRESSASLVALATFAVGLLPLVPSAIKAVRGYLALSVRSALSAPQAAVLAQQTGHEPLPRSQSFGSGSALTALLELPRELVGQAYGLYFIGAAVLLWRWRWRALPLLALPLLFIAAGLRITLVFHNYAAIWPVVVLILTLGADGLGWRQGWRPDPTAAHRSPRSAAALQFVLTGYCLAMAHAHLPVMRANDHGAPTSIPWWNARPFEAALAENGGRTPVMVRHLDYHSDVLPLWCAGIRDLTRWAHCTAENLWLGDHERVHGWHLGSRGSREIAWRADGPDRGGRLAEAQLVMQRPAWRAHGWLVFEGPLPAPPTEFDTALRQRCVRIASERRLTLLRCPPEVVAQPGETMPAAPPGEGGRH